MSIIVGRINLLLTPNLNLGDEDRIFVQRGHNLYLKREMKIFLSYSRQKLHNLKEKTILLGRKWNKLYQKKKKKQVNNYSFQLMSGGSQKIYLSRQCWEN